MVIIINTKFVASQSGLVPPECYFRKARNKRAADCDTRCRSSTQTRFSTSVPSRTQYRSQPECASRKLHRYVPEQATKTIAKEDVSVSRCQAVLANSFARFRCN